MLYFYFAVLFSTPYGKRPFGFNYINKTQQTQRFTCSKRVNVCTKRSQPDNCFHFSQNEGLLGISWILLKKKNAISKGLLRKLLLKQLGKIETGKSEQYL